MLERPAHDVRDRGERKCRERIQGRANAFGLESNPRGRLNDTERGGATSVRMSELPETSDRQSQAVPGSNAREAGCATVGRIALADPRDRPQGPHTLPGR